MPTPTPDRSFLPTSSTINRPSIQAIKESAMSLRATTPYYSSAHTATARKVSTTAVSGTGAGMKEGVKKGLSSPWVVAVLPFLNGGISGMVVSPAMFL